MNGTFMFDHDRLGPEEDFYQSYQAVRGRRLDERAVTSIMRSTCDTLLAAYDDPEHFDDFPTLRDVGFLRGLARTHRLGAVSNI